MYLLIHTTKWNAFFFLSVESVKLTHDLKSHSGDTTPVICCTHHLADYVATYFLALAYWVAQWSWFAWVNALCNLSCKKLWEVTASLPGQFLSRHRFTLCMAMKLNPELRSSTNATNVAVAKLTRQSGWRVGKKKVSSCLFLADRKIASSWK